MDHVGQCGNGEFPAVGGGVVDPQSVGVGGHLDTVRPTHRLIADRRAELIGAHPTGRTGQLFADRRARRHTVPGDVLTLIQPGPHDELVRVIDRTRFDLGHRQRRARDAAHEPHRGGAGLGDREPGRRMHERVFDVLGGPRPVSGRS